MICFVGEYERQMDDRNRFILPAKIREKLSGRIYITKAPVDECLNLYTAEEWGEISEKFKGLPTGIDTSAGKLQRKIFGKAIDCDLDKQGRVTLSADLMRYAKIKKDIVLVGANTRLEIWGAENFADTCTDDDIIIEEIKQYNINI